MGKINIDLDNYKLKLEALAKTADELSKFTWDNKTAIQYCEKAGIKVSDIIISSPSRFHSLYDSLNRFNFASLIDKIQACERKCNELKVNNFDDFNEPYQAYINTTLTNIYNQISLFFDGLNNVVHPNEYLNNLANGLQQLQNNLNPNVNELFDHFKYGNKNYVIFGKNGAGKTTLLKQISVDLFKNAVVIPANGNVNPHTDN